MHLYPPSLQSPNWARGREWLGGFCFIVGDESRIYVDHLRLADLMFFRRLASKRARLYVRVISGESADKWG